LRARLALGVSRQERAQFRSILVRHEMASARGTSEYGVREPWRSSAGRRRSTRLEVLDEQVRRDGRHQEAAQAQSHQIQGGTAQWAPRITEDLRMESTLYSKVTRRPVKRSDYAPVLPNPPCPRSLAGNSTNLHELDLFDPLEHELRDAHATLHRDRRRTEVDERDQQLAAVVGIDGRGSVGEGDAV